MKLTAIIMLTASLQVAANLAGQTVTLKVKNAPLKQVLVEIQEQTGFSILFDNQLVEKAGPVTLNVRNMPVNEVMNICLKDQPFQYSVGENLIIIKPQPPSFVDGKTPSLDSPPVNGIIRDADGNPIAGVNVVIKGTKRGITTDAQGKFSIDAKENDVLVISSIGYSAREVKIVSINVLHIIALNKSASQLDEVQYIAYGKSSPRFNTGNVASVRASDIEKQPVNNPLLALQGRVPGLTVTQSTGVAGGAVTVRIQGRNNLSTAFTGSDPLIIIDGIPYPSQNLLTFQSGFNGANTLGIATSQFSAPGSTLSLINPTDIESIDILKDADATAIYGSRAANGAIIITTKKGKSGNTALDLSIQSGWATVPNKIDILETGKYLEMRREAFKNDNLQLPSIDDNSSDANYDINGLWDTTRYTDWQRELIGGTASFSRASLSISGGTLNVNYLIGGTYSRETSVFPGDFSNTRGAVHFNINSSSADKRFQVQFGGNYLTDNNGLPGNDFTQYIFLPPNAPSLYDRNGALNWAPDGNGISSWTNPLSANSIGFENKSTNLIGNALLSYKILRNLEIKGSLGYNSLSINQFIGPLDESFKPEERSSLTRTAVFTNNSVKSWIAEPQLFYKPNLGTEGIMEILVGASFQEKRSDGILTYASGQSSDQLLRNLAAATTYQQQTIFSVYRYSALFGRINYTLNDRYLINISARRDGSSRFGSNNLFHSFGAIGAGWIFSKEKATKKLFPFLSFGKIRLSYGSTGNDQIADYLFMSLYSPTLNTVPYQNTRGSQTGGIVNPNLQWEETKKLQGGIDVGFIRDKILISAGYYQNRTSNTLTNVNLPIMAGAGGFTGNFPALIQNSGYEFSVRTENIKASNGLIWSTNFNLTIPKNKLVKFPDLETSTSSDLLQVGQPLTIVKTFSHYGVDPQTGEYLQKNAKGDVTSTPDYALDRFAILNTMETFYGGLQNSISYKGFQLDFLVQFVKQKGFDFLEIGIPGTFDPLTANQPVSVLRRWQKPGDVTDMRRYTTDFTLPYFDDRTYNDISFIRLKTVSFSYSVNKQICRKAGLKDAKFFVNAQNILTITPYQGLDPETQSMNTLPPLRVITIGIQARF